MDERVPPGKPEKADGKGSAHPHGPDTRMAQDTVTPEQIDSAWIGLNATRVTASDSDSSSGNSALDSPANHTQMASRILGKDITFLGGFQLIKKLGEGAMGAVYKARQITRDGQKLEKPRTVALKILFPHVAANPKLIDRLNREGRVMGRLDHPNIVQAYATDEADGFHYVAMEYVSGQSMQKWLTQLGRIPVADAIRVALDCAASAVLRPSAQHCPSRYQAGQYPREKDRPGQSCRSGHGQGSTTRKCH